MIKEGHCVPISFPWGPMAAFTFCIRYLADPVFRAMRIRTDLVTF